MGYRILLVLLLRLDVFGDAERVLHREQRPQYSDSRRIFSNLRLLPDYRHPVDNGKQKSCFVPGQLYFGSGSAIHRHYSALLESSEDIGG